MLRLLIVLSSASLLSACMTDDQLDRAAAAANPLVEEWGMCAYKAAASMAYSQTAPEVIASAALGMCKMEEIRLRQVITDGVNSATATEVITTRRAQLWGNVVAFVVKVRARRA